MERNCNTCINAEWNEDFNIDREQGDETYICECSRTHWKIYDEEEIEEMTGECEYYEEL